MFSRSFLVLDFVRFRENIILEQEDINMTMENFEGYKYIDGGVCAAQGFVANGLNCGINPDKNKNDLWQFLLSKV